MWGGGAGAEGKYAVGGQEPGLDAGSQFAEPGLIRHSYCLSSGSGALFDGHRAGSTQTRALARGAGSTRPIRTF